MQALLHYIKHWSVHHPILAKVKLPGQIAVLCSKNEVMWKTMKNSMTSIIVCVQIGGHLAGGGLGRQFINAYDIKEDKMRYHIK
jgi:hypothetical protein